MASFGGVAGFFALFFFSDIPRVRKDIVQKIPIIGPHYIREVPASDNVGGNLSSINLAWQGEWKENESGGKLACASTLLTCSGIGICVAGRTLWLLIRGELR